ncbi:MAG TPA: ABC transporter permease, partial [Chitinophagaceae bacterium]
MFKTYLKTAWRNLSRHKTNSLINIVGLIVGLSAFLLIFLVVRYEKGFDDFHSHPDRIFRVVRIGRNPVNREYRTGVPFPAPAGLRSDIPGSATVAAIQAAHDIQVLIGNEKATKRFKEAAGVFAAEPQFFDIFNFPLLAGRATSLKEPHNALLSKTLAEKYYGDWHKAVGQEFRVPPDMTFRVTGVLQDPPDNTDFPLEMVVSYATLMEHRDPNDWGSISDENYCIVKLHSNQDATQYSRQLSTFVEKRIKPVNPGYVLALQPLNEIHHDERYGTFSGAVFTNDLIIALSLIGAFLLIIACVNFINLTTAQAALRSREVGVRKVLGGNRRQLMFQFLGETGLTSLISLLGALLVVYITLPLLNSLLGIHIAASVLLSAGMLIFLVGTLLVVTFLSGFYPALVLSAYRSAIVLKGGAATDEKGGALFRRGLVVFQFVIAQALIIGTLVVASQMNYFRNADMGFTRHAVLNASFPNDSISLSKMGALNNELSGLGGVEAVSFSSFAPAEGGGWYTDLRRPQNQGQNPDMIVAMKPADTSYFRLYGLTLVAGRIYFPSDTMHE